MREFVDADQLGPGSTSGFYRVEHRPLARFVTYATAGVAPERFGIGPVPAIRKALKLAGLSLDDIDLIEATFGPNEGQRHGYCGHPEVELALVKLYHATHDKRFYCVFIGVIAAGITY